MPHVFLMFCSIFLLFATTAVGYAKPMLVKIGNSPITIPPPKGFYELGNLAPNVRGVFEATTPEINKLLAVFMTWDDMEKARRDQNPAKERYAIIQFNKKAENENLSDSKFSDYVKAIRNNYAKSMNVDLAQSEATRSSTSVSRKSGNLMKINVGDVVNLGEFTESPNHVGFLSVIKFQSVQPGKTNEYLMAFTFTLVHVNKKPLFLYFYTKYRSDEDLEWVRSASQNWVNDILSQNPSMASDDIKSDEGPSSSVNWNKVVSSVLVGGIAGGVFAFVARRIRRKKTSSVEKKTEVP